MPDFEDLKSKLRNVQVYAVTPFLADDICTIDLTGLAENLEFLADRRVQVVCVAGGTGEVEALSEVEIATVARTALETLAARALVVTSLPGDLGSARQLLQHYVRLGVEAVLALPPLVRWKVPDDLLGVVDYYRQLAGLSDLALIPYNTQAWPVDIFERLAEIDRIVAVKDPCQNELEFFRAIKRLGDRFVWIGNKRHDPGVLHLRYQMGMEAFTSGQGNFMPEPELEMHEAASRREWGRVIELQEAVAALERVRDAHDDAAMVKAAMDLLGLKGGRVRPPRRDVPTEDREALASLLGQLEVRRAPSTAEAP